MCGIIAYLGYKPGIKQAYEGLLILKNRGYDSAGISSIVIHDDVNKFILDKYATTTEQSAFDMLVPNLPNHKSSYNCILHSRWSVVGTPTTNNSHPHIDYTNQFSLVHNGIIENHNLLRKELLEIGIEFKSETDTEVIVNLIGYYSQKYDVKEAIDMTINRLEGTWGLVIQNLNEPDKLYCARHGSPLLVGIEDDFVMISSEQTGFAKYVKNYISIKSDDIIELKKENGKIKFSKIDDYIVRKVKLENFDLTPDPFPHWTLKEIHEQFDVSIRAMGMGSRINNDKSVKLGGLDSHINDLIDIDNLIILGCGTSYHAGLYSLNLFRKIGDFNTVQVVDGSDFNEYDIPKTGKTGLIVISQSGETKDLHRCVDLGKTKNLTMIGVINVVDSMIATDVQCGVYMNAGREVGVASTKCFTSEIIILSMIACWFAQNKHVHEKERIKLLRNLKTLPNEIKNVIENTNQQCINVAEYLSLHESSFLLGRGKNKAIAMEGALKIKELGYINANGCSTASLKHGSYALLEKDFPVILLLPNDLLFARNNSVGNELKSRESFVIIITDKDDIDNDYDMYLTIPKNELFYGVLANICLQLIAYYVAILKGNNVDCPKNLCKTISID